MMLQRKAFYIALVMVACLWALMPGGTGHAASSEAETINESMAYLQSYTYGNLRTPLSTLEKMVLRSAADDQLQSRLEAGFIKLLNEDATTDHALQFVVRQLAVMGSERCVPALVAHLDNPEVADGVIRALETMPAPEAYAALLNAARELPYPHPAMTGYFQPKLGAVQALARLQDQDAVPVMIELADHDDATIRESAYEALGRIGGDAACMYLSEALENTDPPSDALADACLRCADASLYTGDMAAAQDVLDALDNRELPGYLQAAVVNARMKLEGVNQAALAMRSANSDAREVRQTGVHWLIRTEGEEISEGIAENLDTMESEYLEIALKALAFREDTAASQGVIAFLESDSHPDLKEQIIETLAHVGDESALEPLLNIMLHGEGSEKQLAEASLARIRGNAVNARLKEMAQGDNAERQLAAIELLGARRALDAAPLLLELAESDDEAVQSAALRSLQTVAGTDHVGGLLNLAKENPALMGQVEQTLVLIGQRNRDELDLSDPAKNARDLSNIEDETVQRLALSVLGRLGGPEALEIVSHFLDADDRPLRNHAAMILASWSDVAVMPALERVMLDSPRFDVAIRNAALRGALRLLREDTSLAPEVKLAYLQTIDSLDKSDDDARQMLGVAGSVPHLDAFEWLHEGLEDTPFVAEQHLALVEVAALIAGAYPEAVLETLDSLDLASQPENTQNIANHARHVIHNSRDHLTAWKMAGPYRENALVGEALFNTAFAPEFDDQEVAWRIVQIGVQGDLPARIALGTLYPEYEQTAYLRTQIHVDEAVDAVLTLHSPNSLRVWLNGEEVQADAMEQDLLPRDVEAPLALEAGDNEVMLAVTQYNAGWFVECQLHDSDGNLLSNFESSVD